MLKSRGDFQKAKMLVKVRFNIMVYIVELMLD